MKDSFLLVLLLIVIASLHVIKIKHMPPVYTNIKNNVSKYDRSARLRQVTVPAKYISPRKDIQNNFPND